ncbi:MAG TPA: N-acetylglucosamine kinase [Bacteroidia bacterium]|nr:N-acetylglucosamine kinase [Bacteroidia bacterium]
MILVADSGSTKADWISGENGTVNAEFHTKGFNPFFHDKSFIIPELEANKGLVAIHDKVQEVYFFGAGCSSEDRNAIIKEGLSSFFTNAHIIVDHDMLGCALSVCGGKAGMACILGTGSNICYFDGSNISDTRHGLGYVIGDEGSGSYFGKKLLAWYLYKILPPDLDKAFKDKYKLDKEKIIQKVYKEPDPNVFLASFAKFLSDHKEHEFIRKMIYTGFEEFFVTNVLSYKESKKVPVHFVGSIAWHFKDILEQIAQEKGVTVGNVIQKPVNGLAAYFLNGGKMP